MITRTLAVPESVPRQFREYIVAYLAEVDGPKGRHVPGWIKGFAGNVTTPWERDLVDLSRKVRIRFDKTS